MQLFLWCLSGQSARERGSRGARLPSDPCSFHHVSAPLKSSALQTWHQQGSMRLEIPVPHSVPFTLFSVVIQASLGQAMLECWDICCRWNFGNSRMSCWEVATFYTQCLFLVSPARNPAVGLAVWLLICAAGQSHPNLAVGVCGPWGRSTGHARRKPEPSRTGLERQGGGGRGGPAAVFSHLRGVMGKGAPGSSQRKNKRPRAWVAAREIPDAALHP